MYHNNEMEYIAICEEFAHVPMGNEIPEYSIVIDSRVTELTKLERQGTRQLILVPNEEIGDDM